VVICFEHVGRLALRLEPADHDAVEVDRDENITATVDGAEALAAVVHTDGRRGGPAHGSALHTLSIKSTACFEAISVTSPVEQVLQKTVPALSQHADGQTGMMRARSCSRSQALRRRESGDAKSLLPWGDGSTILCTAIFLCWAASRVPGFFLNDGGEDGGHDARVSRLARCASTQAVKSERSQPQALRPSGIGRGASPLHWSWYQEDVGRPVMSLRSRSRTMRSGYRLNMKEHLSKACGAPHLFKEESKFQPPIWHETRDFAG
jgi:hypothetical protein